MHSAKYKQSFVCSFVRLLLRYLLNTYCGPVSLLDAANIAVNKTDKNSYPHGAYILWRKRDDQQIDE